VDDPEPESASTPNQPDPDAGFYHRLIGECYVDRRMDGEVADSEAYMKTNQRLCSFTPFWASLIGYGFLVVKLFLRPSGCVFV
jgi:hypothetical protein